MSVIPVVCTSTIRLCGEPISTGVGSFLLVTARWYITSSAGQFLLLPQSCFSKRLGGFEKLEIHT